MRALFLAAGTVLLLAACGKNDQAGNAMNVDENLAAENIVSNDVTAIDAVTGDAANMAADMDVNFTAAPDSEPDNGASPSRPRSKAPATPAPAAEAPVSNDSAADNSAATNAE